MKKSLTNAPGQKRACRPSHLGARRGLRRLKRVLNGVKAMFSHNQEILAVLPAHPATESSVQAEQP